jgi:plasmid stabilization system protein ParE
MMTIFWSELAKIDYWENIDYLEKEWTPKEDFNFINKVDELINLLAQENLIFKPTAY